MNRQRKLDLTLEDETRLVRLVLEQGQLDMIEKLIYWCHLLDKFQDKRFVGAELKDYFFIKILPNLEKFNLTTKEIQCLSRLNNSENSLVLGNTSPRAGRPYSQAENTTLLNELVKSSALGSPNGQKFYESLCMTLPSNLRYRGAMALESHVKHMRKNGYKRSGVSTVLQRMVEERCASKNIRQLLINDSRKRQKRHDTLKNDGPDKILIVEVPDSDDESSQKVSKIEDVNDLTINRKYGLGKLKGLKASPEDCTIGDMVLECFIDKSPVHVLESPIPLPLGTKGCYIKNLNKEFAQAELIQQTDASNDNCANFCHASTMSENSNMLEQSVQTDDSLSKITVHGIDVGVGTELHVKDAKVGSSLKSLNLRRCPTNQEAKDHACFVQDQNEKLEKIFTHHRSQNQALSGVVSNFILVLAGLSSALPQKLD